MSSGDQNGASSAQAAGGISPDEAPDQDALSGYQPPAEKTIDDIVKCDPEDEALQKYTETLLGSAVAGTGSVAAEPDDPRNVIVKKLALVVEGRPDLELDLTCDLKEIKKKSFVVKEGVQFRIRIDFIVQREIVTGLKYVQKTTRMGVTVDKMNQMVGSYAPKETVQSYTTPSEDAPSGLTGRGSYHVHSLFCDDDQSEHLKWEWTLEIKKDW